MESSMRIQILVNAAQAAKAVRKFGGHVVASHQTIEASEKSLAAHTLATQKTSYAAQIKAAKGNAEAIAAINEQRIVADAKVAAEEIAGRKAADKIIIARAKARHAEEIAAENAFIANLTARHKAFQANKAASEKLGDQMRRVRNKAREADERTLLAKVEAAEKTSASRRAARAKAISATRVAAEKTAAKAIETTEKAAAVRRSARAKRINADRVTSLAAASARMVAIEKARLAQVEAMEQAAAAKRAARMASLGALGAATPAAMKGIIGGFGKATAAASRFATSAVAGLTLVSRALAHLGGRVSAFGKQMQWLGRQIEFRLSLPLAAVAGVGIKMALDFDRAFTKLRKVYNGAEEDLVQIEEAVWNLSTTFGINAIEITDMSEQWAAMGATGQEMIFMMQETARFSALTGVSMEDSAVRVLVAWQAFGGEIEIVSDRLNTLNALENQTSANADQLSTAIQIAGANAGVSGVSFGFLAAALSTVIPLGGSATKVGTAFNTMFQRINNPTKKATEAFAMLGIAVQDTNWILSSGNEKLLEMAAGWDAASSSQQRFIAAQIFGVKRSGIGILLLEKMNSAAFTNALAWTEAGEGMDNYHDAAERAALAQKEIVTQLGSDSQVLKIFGERIRHDLVMAMRPLIPMLLQMTKGISDLVASFNDLSPSTKKTIAIVAGLIAVLGPLMGIMGALIIVVGTVISAFGTLLSVLLAPILIILKLGAAILALVNPFTVAAAAAAAFILWFIGFDGIIAGVQRAISSLPPTFANALNNLLQIVAGYVRAIWGWLQMLNPFHRQSPSLVDNVRNGVSVIIAEYSRLNNIDLSGITKKLRAFGKIAANLRIKVAAEEAGEKRDLVKEFAPADLKAYDGAIKANIRLQKAYDKTGRKIEAMKAKADAFNDGIDGYRAEMDAYSDSIKAYEGTMDAAQDGIDSYKDSMDDFSDAMDDQRDVIEQFEDALKASEDALSSAEDKMASLESQADDLADAISNSRNEIDRLSDMNLTGESAADDGIFSMGQERKALELEVAKLELAFGHMEEMPANVVAEMERLEDAMDQLDLQMDIADLQRDIEFDPLHREIEQLADPIEEMAFGDVISGILAEQANIDILQSSIAGINAEIAAQATVVENLTAARDADKAALEGQKEILEGMQDTYEGMQDHLEGMQDDLAGMQDHLDGMNDTYGAMGEHLEGLEDQHAGMLDEISAQEEAQAKIGEVIQSNTDDLDFFITRMEDLKRIAEEAAAAAEAAGVTGGPTGGGGVGAGNFPDDPLGAESGELFPDWDPNKSFEENMLAYAMGDLVDLGTSGITNPFTDFTSGLKGKIDFDEVTKLANQGITIPGIAHRMGLDKSAQGRVEEFLATSKQSPMMTRSADGGFEVLKDAAGNDRTRFSGGGDTGQNVFVKAGEGIEEGLTRISDWWDAHGEDVKEGFREMGDRAEEFWESFKNNKWVIQFIETFESLRDSLDTIIEKAGGVENFIKGLGALGLILGLIFGGPILIIGLLIGALILLEANTGFVSKAIEWLSPIIGGMFESLAGWIDLIVALFNGDWAGAWEAAKGIVHGMYTQVLETANLILGALGVLADWIWENRMTIWNGLWDGLTWLWENAIWPFLTGLAGLVLGAATAIGTYLWDNAADIWGGLMDGLDWLWDELLWPAISGLAVAVYDGAVAIGGYLLDHADDIWGGLMDGLDWLWDELLWPAITGMAALIGGGALAIGRWLFNHADDIWNALWEGLLTAVNYVVDHLPGWILDIGGALLGMGAWIIENAAVLFLLLLDLAGETIVDIVTAIPGWVLDVGEALLGFGGWIVENAMDLVVTPLTNAFRDGVNAVAGLLPGWITGPLGLGEILQEETVAVALDAGEAMGPEIMSGAATSLTVTPQVLSAADRLGAAIAFNAAAKAQSELNRLPDPKIKIEVQVDHSAWDAWLRANSIPVPNPAGRDSTVKPPTDYYDDPNNWPVASGGIVGFQALASGGLVSQIQGFKTRGPTLVGEGNPAFPEFVIPTDPKYHGNAMKLYGALSQELGLTGSGSDSSADLVAPGGDTTIHFHGDLSFPNVNNEEDAEDFLRTLESLSR